MESGINSLLQLLNRSHSVFHAVAALEQTLLEQGYRALREQDAWDLVPGGKYYLNRNGSALVAFRIPQAAPTGFLMAAAHSDRPGFKVKEDPELKGPYTRLSTERYGGMLISTWLDRPLSVAGRVLVQTEQGVESRLVDIDRDLLLIPNVAIHMNRQVNEGYQWNPAVDTLPLAGTAEAAGQFHRLLEEAAGGKVLGHDLYLYVRQEASCWGLDREYISAQAIDDLECAWACTQGFLQARESAAIPVLCIFDNEEVGSQSFQGAASDLLESTLARICGSLSLALPRMLAQSFMVSADNAHALHPNHPELSDPAHAPVMGKGVVIKFAASQRYTSDGLSAAIFRRICQDAGVPLQTFFNRGDIAGGSTLGNISLSHVSVPSVDIGAPQLAMHSSYETAAVSDALALVDAMTAYYGVTLQRTATGYALK